MEQRPAGTFTDEWLEHHFDHLAPELADPEVFQRTLERLREGHGMARSDRHEGFWVATRYEDVLRIAQDWETFSSEHGITVPARETPLPAIPEQVDPPLHREFKRLINRYFTPAAVLEQEDATRAIVTRLIDGFVEDGGCEFMHAFAHPLPGLVFFELFLHAPAEELEEINRLANLASTPTTPEAIDARRAMIGWIFEFAKRRREEPPRGDVVDAVLAAEIEGRPITELEVVGVIQLLLFGGLDTTAGALGQAMIHLCRDPSLPARLREEPGRIPDAVEEVLRIDGPFAFIGRCAMADTEVGGRQIRAGDMVLLSWASANRDEGEFACPAQLDIDREANRHIAFGAGPHRCAGSNLARMNLRIAVEELTRRLHDLRLVDDVVVPPGYSRAPASVAIEFAPGPRSTG
jgi:cytochrome P450